MDTLRLMQEDHHQRELDRDALRLALRLVNLLNESLTELNRTLDDVEVRVRGSRGDK